MKIKDFIPHRQSPCSNCPFRKDVLKGWLDGEIEEIIERGTFVCHKNTSLQCAGHMILKGEENDFVQIAQRLGHKLELSGKELIFESKTDCINHHLKI